MIIYGKAPAFHRPQRKPQAWGPVSAVQASIFKNAERIGIDPVKIANCTPFWEMAGLKVQDYSINSLIGNHSVGNWQGDGLYFSTNNYVQMPYKEELNFSGKYDITLLTVVKFLSDPGDAGSVFFSSLNNETGSSAAKLYFDNFGSTHGLMATNFTSTSTPDLAGYLTLGKDYVFGLSCDSVSQIWYRNGIITRLVSSSRAIFTGNDFPPVGYRLGGIYHISKLSIVYKGVLSNSQIAYLSDNPYFLLQRVAPVYYSIPATGGGPSTGSVSGPLSFSGGLTRTINYHRLLSGAI